MARSLETWRGKTDDAKVPPRVRLRIFQKHGGICHISGRKIEPGEKWELEHIKALILGGTHSEDNLAPALIGPHKRKTAVEMSVKAKIDRCAKKHLGITELKGDIKSKGFAKAEKVRPASSKTLPPRRPLFRSIQP